MEAPEVVARTRPVAHRLDPSLFPLAEFGPNRLVDNYWLQAEQPNRPAPCTKP